MIENVIAAVVYTILLVVLLALIYKRGIAGTFEMIRDGMEAMVRRIVYGPEKKRAAYTGPDGCKILHENAKIEMEAYGTILSYSVLSHVKGCTKHPSIFLYPRLSPRPPRPHRPECTHEGTMRDVDELDGTKHVYCISCDYYKRIEPMPRTSRSEFR